MKAKNFFPSLLFLIGLFLISSCFNGIGDVRDKNLEQATLARLDSVAGIRFVGISNTREIDENKFQAVIIYYVTDSIGNRNEYNVRVTTNYDCSEIYSWEELDSEILSDIKNKVSEKMSEKGIDLNESLIDALMKIKKR